MTHILLLANTENHKKFKEWLEKLAYNTDDRPRSVTPWVRELKLYNIVITQGAKEKFLSDMKYIAYSQTQPKGAHSGQVGKLKSWIFKLISKILPIKAIDMNKVEAPNEKRIRALKYLGLEGSDIQVIILGEMPDEFAKMDTNPEISEGFEMI